MLLCLLSVPCRADGQDRQVLRRAADRIEAHQVSDGAIVMEAAPATESHIVPYFANLAALGVIAAYRETREPRYLQVARRWVDWYAAHQDRDGTIQDHQGAPGAWRPAGKYDSSDSYAGTYLELLLAIHKAAPDTTWLRRLYPSTLGALAAIRLTLQSNGLTTATPQYPVMYTMDATETLRGLRAAVEIAHLLGDGTQARDCGRLADRMEAAIGQELWDPKAQCYRIGIQTDGGKMEGLIHWYPDVTANLMAVGWLPPSERNRSLYARLKARFAMDLPTRIRTEEDSERLLWWGMAARGAGDAAMTKRIRAVLSGFDASSPAFGNPALLGHLCRLFAQP